MTAKELIDNFIQGKIAANHLRDYADMENIPIPTLLNLMRQEVKEAEAEQARHSCLLERIRLSPLCEISPGLDQEIRDLLNGN